MCIFDLVIFIKIIIHLTFIFIKINIIRIIIIIIFTFRNFNLIHKITQY